MTEKRFTIEREVDMFTGRQSAIHLIDKVGNLPRMVFNDPSDLYEWEKAFMKEWSSLKEENEQLKSEIKDLNDVLARYEEKELKE